MNGAASAPADPPITMMSCVGRSFLQMGLRRHTAILPARHLVSPGYRTQDTFSVDRDELVDATSLTSTGWSN